MKQKFSKKIYSFKLLFTDLGFVLYKSPKIISAFKNKEISKSFREKIMMIVSVVNDCRYCKFFHAKIALSSGLSEKEVNNLINLQFQTDASKFEILGLLYAQHYAETDRKPGKKDTDKLFEYYGTKTANHIIILIRMIFIGNLSGNTFDAFLNVFNKKG